MTLVTFTCYDSKNNVIHTYTKHIDIKKLGLYVSDLKDLFVASRVTTDCVIQGGK